MAYEFNYELKTRQVDCPGPACCNPLAGVIAVHRQHTGKGVITITGDCEDLDHLAAILYPVMEAGWSKEKVTDNG